MPAPAAAGRELAATLGPERAIQVGRVVADRARRWAQEAFGPDAVTVLAADDADGTGVAADDPRRSGLAAAFAGDARSRRWPVIAVAPELPAWRSDLAAAALQDLDEGCTLTLGPVFDGGFYLVGLARPLPTLGELAAVDLAGHDALGALVSLAEREQLEVGLLRTERGLRRPADVRALLADPLTDRELRALLG